MAKPSEIDRKEIQPYSASSLSKWSSQFPFESAIRDMTGVEETKSYRYFELERFLHPLLLFLNEHLPNEEDAEVKHSPGVLKQIEMHVAQQIGLVMEMEMKRMGTPEETIRDEISISDMKVKEAFARVKYVFKCINPSILNDQVPNVLREHGNSQLQEKWRDYKHEIQTSGKFLECIFREIDGDPDFVESMECKELRMFNERLMNLVEKWNSSMLGKKAISPDGRGKRQSKEVVSEQNSSMLGQTAISSSDERGKRQWKAVISKWNSWMLGKRAMSSSDKRGKRQWKAVVFKWKSWMLGRGAKSSDARSKPQSKAVVSKRIALQTQDNLHKDDLEELNSPDLAELESVLERSACSFAYLPTPEPK